MSDAFYSHARLYDLMFPGGGPSVDFYRAEANRQGGRVLELGCGTGHKLIPIAADSLLHLHDPAVLADARDCPQTAMKLPVGGHENCPLMVMGSTRHDIVCVAA